jgi:biopolymer transport protein TolR
MARRSTHTDPITKINVTPIIDVALVLVIILLVTAPMLSVADLPVDLPQARTRGLEDERNISLTLSRSGAVAIDEHEVGRGALRAALAARLAEESDERVLVVIRADAGLPYADVRAVLEDARAAGAKRLAIATRQSGADPS